MQGGYVCKLHGGATPQVKAKAQQRRVMSFTEGKIAKLLQECDMPLQHPLDGLLEVVQRSGAMMRLLGGLVGELDTQQGRELVGIDDEGNATYRERGFYGADHNGDGAEHILVKMYHKWSVTYAKACKLALDANIDERMIRNSEATSELMYTAVKKALDATGLTPVQAGLFSGTLAAELRKLTGPLDATLVPGAR